jgi:hypothetical protein
MKSNWEKKAQAPRVATEEGRKPLRGVRLRALPDDQKRCSTPWIPWGAQLKRQPWLPWLWSERATLI